MTTTTKTTSSTTTTTPATATTTTTLTATTTSEREGQYHQKSQGQIDFEDQVASQRECLYDEGNSKIESMPQTGTFKQKKQLPLIDLFLNPERDAEKEALLLKTQKEETKLEQKQVRDNHN